MYAVYWNGKQMVGYYYYSGSYLNSRIIWFCDVYSDHNHIFLELL